MCWDKEPLSIGKYLNEYLIQLIQDDFLEKIFTKDGQNMEPCMEKSGKDGKISSVFGS